MAKGKVFKEEFIELWGMEFFTFCERKAFSLRQRKWKENTAVPFDETVDDIPIDLILAVAVGEVMLRDAKWKKTRKSAL